MPVYLDYNASAPIRPSALDAVNRAFLDTPGNAASPHEFGQRAAMTVQNARRAIADRAGCAARDVVFTSGATEANNLAILGLEAYGRETGSLHIVCSAIEHPSVLEPCRALAARGFSVEFVSPGPNGVISADDLLAAVRPDTLLVCLMHANNETGALQPVAAVAAALAPTQTLLHVDAAQSFGKEPELHLGNTLSVTAHKLGGPQGIGALVFPKGRATPHRAIAFGGMQEWGLRPGTLPVPLAAGFAAAAAEAYENLSAERAAMAETRTHFLAQLQGVAHKLYAQDSPCMPNTLYVHFPSATPERLARLTTGACALSGGAACASLHSKPSHVLLAMGVPADEALRVLRFSWGPKTGRPDVSQLLAQL